MLSFEYVCPPPLRIDPLPLPSWNLFLDHQEEEEEVEGYMCGGGRRKASQGWRRIFKETDQITGPFLTNSFDDPVFERTSCYCYDNVYIHTYIYIYGQTSPLRKEKGDTSDVNIMGIFDSDILVYR